MGKKKEEKNHNPELIEPFIWTEEDLEEMREELLRYDMDVLGLNEKKAREWADLSFEVDKNPDLEPWQILEKFNKKHPK